MFLFCFNLTGLVYIMASGVYGRDSKANKFVSLHFYVFLVCFLGIFFLVRLFGYILICFGVILRCFIIIP